MTRSSSRKSSADLLAGHSRFRRSFAAKEHDFLLRLAGEGQSPDALYVGCSDSRVVPELLTSASPGDLFVVRNVANIVPPFEHADASVGAALEYAVEHLRVPHVIVCGHYGCGGIAAVIADDPHVRSLPSLHEWLEGARPGVTAARESGETGEALWRRAVEENVLEQLGNLASYSHIAVALEAKALELHGWVYDLFTLELRVFDGGTGEFVKAESVIGG